MEITGAYAYPNHIEQRVSGLGARATFPMVEQAIFQKLGCITQAEASLAEDDAFGDKLSGLILSKLSVNRLVLESMASQLFECEFRTYLDNSSGHEPQAS